MKGCTSKNQDGQECQAHVVEGTDRCRYHPKKEITIKRGQDGGGAALKLVLTACKAERRKVRVAFANYGTGKNAGKLKLHPWAFVDAINARPQFNDYGIKLSGRPRPFSSQSILAVVTTVE